MFYRDDLYQRAVAQAGKRDYEHLMESGLYGELTRQGLLVQHEERREAASAGVYAVLVPEQVEFVSYPYEWGFEQLKDAALLTLEVTDRALRRGMTLKDASAFNVQFRGARPVFVDTLSFTINDGGPWIAYEQFCRHFLAPLLLMSQVNPTANQYFRVDLDGIPLEIASRALPLRTWVYSGALLHVHLHARAITRSSPAGSAKVRPRYDGSPALVSSLRGAIAKLRPRREWSRWVDYRSRAAHYPPAAAQFKTRTVEKTLESTRPRLVYDLGANTGEYSRVAARMGARCVAFEADPFCVDECYMRERESGGTTLLPLLMDVCNPSGSLGFSLTERMSLFDRPKAELVMVLALSHHLRLTANVPFVRMAEFFQKLGKMLLVEFVEGADPMVQEIMRTRARPLPDDYSLDGFMAAFRRYFRLEQRAAISGTSRYLCLFRAAG